MGSLQTVGQHYGTLKISCLQAYYSLILGQWSENPGTPTGIQTPRKSFSQIIRLVFSKPMLELCWHYFIQRFVFLTLTLVTLGKNQIKIILN